MESIQLIQLTGKETKSMLIEKLITSGANWEGRLEDSEFWYRKDTKSDLLQKIKIYNANKAAGGDGNISRWANKEAHSHKDKLENELKKWLLTFGLDEKTIRCKISTKKAEELNQKWEDYLYSELNGFVGHTTEEQHKALNKMKELYKSISIELGVVFI